MIYWISYSTGQCGDLQKYHEPCKSNDENKKYKSADRPEQRSLKRFLKLYFEAIDRLYSYHVNLSMAVYQGSVEQNGLHNPSTETWEKVQTY